MSVYQSLYDLISTYIFGGNIVANSYQELVTILISTCGCIFLISIPFLIVWKIIKVIMG